MTQIREKAEALVKKLTLEEKIGMIHGAQLFQTAGVERLGIPPLKMSDGPMGVRQDFGADNWTLVGHSDDYVTYLPCNNALAATWNRTLAFETGSVLGEEARGRGKDVILAPGVNIKRSPLCGRNFEYFSEDPFLTKKLAAAYVEGVQRWDVAACVKHFALNNQETDRRWVDVCVDGQRKGGSYNTAEHRQAALDAARESVVLLKNEEKHLPLSAETVKKVLVIGENAERLHANGGGSAEIKALYEISPLLGIKMLLGGNAQVDYVPGYTSGQKEESVVSWQEASLENGGGCVGEEDAFAEEEEDFDGTEDGEEDLGASFAPGSEPEEGAFGTRKIPAALQRALRKEAIAMAKKDYDAVIYVGGLNHDQDSEGNDRKNMKLPYGQDILIKELLCSRPDAVIVLTGGSPVEMGEWIGQAKTLVWGWYAGMEGGRALAEVLFGTVNPSGKLPETFYKCHTDCSAHCMGEFAQKGTVHYGEGIFVGYRYNETFGVAPQFCFGYGLSYTDFAYRGAERISRDKKAGVAVTVSNTGNCSGAETIQLYRLRDAEDKSRPAKELIGFEKVYLEAGETKTAEVWLDAEETDAVIGVGRSVGEIELRV